MVCSPDPLRGPLAYSAAIAVFDEMLFKNRIEIIEKQVVHDAIAEISGDYLPLDRLIHYEADTPPDRVLAIRNLPIQREYPFFIIRLESQGIGG